MSPLFGSEDLSRKRNINLGGNSSSASHTALLEQAKARRNQRDSERRKQDAAIRLQAWWRGQAEGKRVREALKHIIREDPHGTRGLRALVLAGRDEQALSFWASAMASTDHLLLPLLGSDGNSWRAMLPRVCLQLLHATARRPQSPEAVDYLRIIVRLTSKSDTARILEPNDHFPAELLSYLHRRGFYSLVSAAISAVPVANKACPSLPSLVTLSVAPLVMFGPSSTHLSETLYNIALAEFFARILSIPLLANRLPLNSLTILSKSIPFNAVSTASTQLVSGLEESSIESRAHLIANLLAFAPPRYPTFTPTTLIAYLQLLAYTISGLPPDLFKQASADKGSKSIVTSWGAEDDEDDDTAIQVQRVTSFMQGSTKLPSLDAKTFARLNTVHSVKHLQSLVTAAKGDAKPAFAQFVLALNEVWPAQRSQTLGAIMAHAGGSLLRELYRGWVRGSALGKGEIIKDEALNVPWPPLLLLVELYNHALLTMHDDEFFSSTHAMSGFTASSAPVAAGATVAAAAAAKNPLSIDEVTSFSKQLLNIVFPLYWRDDTSEGGTGAQAILPGVPGMTWITARELMTSCLQALHARDSRRSFAPPNHWIMTTEADAKPFVQAALFEAEQMEENAQDARPIARRWTKRMERQSAAYGPRLLVLNNIPFTVPFEVRVAVFRGWIAKDMQTLAGYDSFSLDAHDVFRRMWRGDQRAKSYAVVRRGHIAEDGFDKLGSVDLKAPIAITFIDQWGMEEAGVDGGGVFKEFFTALCKEVFDLNRGLWLANRVNELYPNPHSYATEAHSLNWYKFIGRILGKALYEGILVDVAFAPFFLAKWLGRQSFLDDLASLDPDLYQGLIFLKHYTGDPEDLALNFTAAVDDFGETRSIDLIPNGSNIPVTRENRLQYIYLISHFRLTRQIRLQSDKFFEGLSEVIDPKWLYMFNQQELQILLGGVNAPVDIQDLQANTQYGGLFDANHPTIELFWKVVASFNQDDRRKMLKFVTSCSRPPLLGFRELYPQLSIRDAGADESRLPTTSTCVNLLKLPLYTSERSLRAKLTQAINANAGFDLS